ncbi:MAG: DUF4433 domain-containing protein [Micrococcales bacterium]|nr:DUF4433 domain-containing protein [Micrococcales bacterium]
MTTGECIHGLEVPLCDVCFPRAVPEPAPPAAGSTSTRSPSSRADRSAPPSRRPAGGTGPAVDLDRQRVQHVTHLENLLSILADGEIRAGAMPAVDVSSATARDLRATTALPGGGSAADRVAFYLTADADRWRELRSGAAGPQWSDAARASRPADFVILVAALGVLGDVVLADGDAAATPTRFASVTHDRPTASRMLRRLVADPEALRRAEALGPPDVPIDEIQLGVVANDPVRERVRGLLDDAGIRLRVAVNPPSFALD